MVILAVGWFFGHFGKKFTPPSVSAPIKQIQWYEGGTLHKATVAQWNAATNQNKLATAADWLAATKWKNHLNSPADFNKMKVKAQILVNAINEAASEKQPESWQITDVATPIMLIANDIGPE